jgi:subtilisin family serine protease
MTYEYYGFTGTSAAAPIVSAETALLLAIGRSDPFRIIYATCDPWTASDPGDTVNPQGTRYIEKGIVNIHRAVAYPDFSFEPVDPEDVNP